jgi:exonuclease III
MRYKTRKLRKQKGRGILRDGIKSISKKNAIPYIKKCPLGTVMCDQDEVNYSLCVPEDNTGLCSDPNYRFKYIPPDNNDRDAKKPINRLLEYISPTGENPDGLGPKQDPTKPVKVFEVEYADSSEDNRSIFEDDVVMKEETGREKSYAPEYHPTSCAVQQKSEATIEMRYNEGDVYKKRVDGQEITLNFTKTLGPKFTILTQNALGLYRGKYRQPSEPGSLFEATYDLMKLRTALFREFLKVEQPDFVCLQESTRTFIDLLDKDSVSVMYPYIYPSEDEMVRQEGNGANATTSMLSKYPAKKATTYMLQGNSSYYNALGIYEFDNLVIFNVYMQAGSEISPGQEYRWENYARCRRQQLMFVKQKIDEINSAPSSAKAIVVLGDFNFELNSIHYRGEGGAAERDENNHLIYDPVNSDMKWSEHKFLVGPNGLNLNDSYKELHIDDSTKVIREGLTENTDINTFRYLGKLEEKALRYDGIFFNNDLVPIRSEVVNNIPTKLNTSVTQVFVSNGVPEYEANIRKYNEEYNKYMIFNPKGNLEAIEKKEAFFSTKPQLNIEDGFELFVSDHFGVLTEFAFKPVRGGKRRQSRRNKRRRRRISKKQRL